MKIVQEYAGSVKNMNLLSHLSLCSQDTFTAKARLISNQQNGLFRANFQICYIDTKLSRAGLSGQGNFYAW